jgi:L-threonylcarbamoyladenylate synthase
MLVTVEEAAQYLAVSQPVAIPTETVWGLAAGLHDARGIEKIFVLKHRPQTNPLIIHLADPEDMFEYTCIAREVVLPLTSAFWPGGLTLVVPVDEHKILPSVRANLPTAAFRVPSHPTCRQLLALTGPVVAPSANVSGRPSATTIEHIERDFGADLPIVKTNVPCSFGVESTILVWGNDRWSLGRLGAICPEELEPILGYEPCFCSVTSQPICPGQMFRHYAPEAALHLGYGAWKQEDAAEYDGVLGYSDREYVGAKTVISLGRSSSPRQVAFRLYSSLRQLDALHLTSVYVDLDVPITDVWRVVVDRLRHAAKKKLIDKEKVE